MKKFILQIALLFFAITTYSQSPQRVVSLAASLTKSLYHLGAEDMVVGHTNYCNIAKDDGKEVVASAIQVNIEKVIALNPDLVLIHTMTKPKTIELLKKAGLKVEIFNTPKDFDEVCTQFLEIGKLVNKHNKAEQIVADVTKQVDEIKKEFSKEKQQKVFFQLGTKPLFSVLDHTYMADFIRFINGENIAKGLKAGTVTREFVLKANPDIIAIVNMGMLSDEEIQIWNSYPDLSAVKKQNIFFVESDMASTPTPIDFLNTMIVLQKNLLNK